ncbi:MAG: LPXTG cell wall anchor domain-containing protein [Microthrixaceae bacterium]
MLRRTIGITATAAAISIAAILPAGAETPAIDTYAAGSFARAVDLTLGSDLLGPVIDELGSNQFSLAETSSSINHTPRAIAGGSAVLTPLWSSDKVESATGVDGDDEDDDCQTIPGLPAEVATDLVCIRTSAKLLEGKPIGTATAAEVVIEIKAPSVIGETELDAIVEQLQAGANTLFDALNDVAQPVEDATQIELRQAINDLINEVQAGNVLARITVAPSTAVSQLTSGNLLASAQSNGAVIEVLPDLLGGALAVATVGASTAAVTHDLTTGAMKPEGGASLIDVSYPNGTLSGLAQLTDNLAGALSTVTSLLPCDGSGPTAALAGLVCFDVGKSVTLDAAGAKALGLDFGPTTVGQHSSVLDVRVLSAAAGGPVARLQLGEAAAAAAVTTPLPRPDAPPTPAPLPKTGGDSAMPLTLALLGVGAAGAALLRRSRTI